MAGLYLPKITEDVYGSPLSSQLAMEAMTLLDTYAVEEVIGKRDHVVVWPVTDRFDVSASRAGTTAIRLAAAHSMEPALETGSANGIALRTHERHYAVALQIGRCLEWGEDLVDENFTWESAVGLIMETRGRTDARQADIIDLTSGQSLSEPQLLEVDGLLQALRRHLMTDMAHGILDAPDAVVTTKSVTEGDYTEFDMGPAQIALTEFAIDSNGNPHAIPFN